MKKTIFRNGIRHPIATKEMARQLRRKGWTHREIATELKISLGSASLWTKEVAITADQRTAILKRAALSAFTPERREKLSLRAKIYLAPTEKYTKQNLLDKIVNFYNENSRIPFKREFNMHREYKRRFGSWNTAIRLAGFNTNPELFAHKFISLDGHRCDSFTEKIIDDWLFENGILHERNFAYQGTKMTADFFVQPNIVIEFFGLAGVQKAYDEVLRKKKSICQELSLRLIEIYPKDMFPKHCLSKLLSPSKLAKI